MKLLKAAGRTAVLAALGLAPLCGVQAQEPDGIEQLQRQLQQMQTNFDRVVQEQRTQIRQQQDQIKQQQTQIETLSKQINSLLKQQAMTPGATSAPPAVAAAPANESTTRQLKELNQKVDQVVEAQKKILPSEFNPAIGLVGETVFSYHSENSDKTGSDRPGGFDVFQRSVELNVSASVDPFAKGYAVINASADSETGEAALGVEEAALQTTSLPWNLELKAGRFFAEFGKMSFIHDHELPFVNRPLVLDQYIGGESRTDGAQLNWLPPINHYVSLTVGLGNGFGGDSPLNNPGTYRSLDGFNYFGRLSTYFDVTPNVELETGVSGLINPSTQDRGGVLVQSDGSTLTEKERRVAGLDLKLSYVPLRNNQFRRLDWGTEVLYSDSRYLMDPDGSLNPDNPTMTAGWPMPTGDEHRGDIGSFGLYSYLTYKWHRQWSAGFLFDWVQSAENNDDETFAYSPYLTWALSHWNQLRLQYTHTSHNAASGLKDDDALYLQWAWIIGAHSHGWQSR